MAKSLNDTIRDEFKSKLSQSKFIEAIIDSDIDKKVLSNALESLLPDKDWKDLVDDEKKLVKKNANKLINNINSQLSNEN